MATRTVRVFRGTIRGEILSARRRLQSILGYSAKHPELNSYFSSAIVSPLSDAIVALLSLKGATKPR